MSLDVSFDNVRVCLCQVEMDKVYVERRMMFDFMFIRLDDVRSMASSRVVFDVFVSTRTDKGYVASCSFVFEQIRFMLLHVRSSLVVSRSMMFDPNPHENCISNI